MTGPERIAEAFARNGTAFMPYLMGGFPTVAASKDVGRAYADGGADLVELGIPFSDPLADGPVIHAAGTQALRAGATVAGVLEICATIAQRVPVVIMCYSNQVLARGAETFARALACAGASGIIVPDLPYEEAPAVLEACDGAGIALVPLVAPTTPDDRMAAIGERARGFLYTVSVTGVTGERDAADAYAAVVGRAKAHTAVPVALGFGISTPDHAAAAAAAGADGVIVGTRLVRAAGEGEDVAALVAEFAAALKG